MAHALSNRKQYPTVLVSPRMPLVCDLLIRLGLDQRFSHIAHFDYSEYDSLKGSVWDVTQEAFKAEGRAWADKFCHSGKDFDDYMDILNDM
jgi:hypothetical protein